MGVQKYMMIKTIAIPARFLNQMGDIRDDLTPEEQADIAANYGAQPMTDAEIAEFTAYQQNAVIEVAHANWVAYQAIAQAALDASDITFARALEDGKTWPQTWKDYRTALRAIVSAPSGDATQPLPVRPAYP